MTLAMSNWGGDFEIAIGLGATHIRLGSDIFGERTAPHA